MLINNKLQWELIIFHILIAYVKVNFHNPIIKQIAKLYQFKT